jgi:hypothetical protein
MSVERRKHVRFKVQGGALAALSRSPTVAGQIINVSEGGLAFRYVASKERSEESSRLNVLVGDRKFHFKTLPFKCVWDSPMPGTLSHNSISIRHCGVKFDDLMDEEKDDLKFFIHHHTTTETELDA